MSDKEHPAVKGFNTMWESIKHVGGKALKWAAYGAVALAAVSLIVPIFAPLAGLVGAVGSLFGISSATGAVTATMISFMKVGAVAGGIMGAAAGVGGLSGALEERKQDAIADYEQAAVARQRATLMQQRSQSVGGGSVAPSAGLGRAQQQGMSL